MKALKFACLFLSVLSISMVCGCGGSVDQFNGSYVKSSSSAYSVADDTLVVEHQSGRYFVIFRKTGFRRIDELGRLGKLELETEMWNAVLDEQTGDMIEQKKGRVISFAFKSKVLLLGNGRYQRIN